MARVTSDEVRIAEYCESVANQLILIAANLRKGRKPETEFEDLIDTYGLEAYGALTELMQTDKLIKREAI